MKFLRLKSVVLLGVLTICGTASANDDFWVGIKAGTLGFGVEGSWQPIGWLDLRAGINFYDYDDTGSQAGINYDATLALDTYYLTGNLKFPASPFRMTLGAFTNNNEVRMASKAMPSYQLGSNSTPYLPADVGTLTSVASFDGVSPYIGGGFDFSIMNRLGLSLDFGVLWQGEPIVSLASDGALALISDPGFLADLEAERLQLEDELKDLKAYPVVSIGFNFNF
ncbi:MAG: hypothetical protein O3A13_07680 [Proteobacteria bacterium]|nr:hypothetical protein [Pseudomonadota bacterium]MDA0993500.1 hypothetical protein [Pseudomonadota bacterium]